MIAYLRATDLGAKIVKERLYETDIPVHIEDSRRSDYVDITIGMLEAIRNDLADYERFQRLRIPKTTKVLIFKEEHLPELRRLFPDVNFNVIDSVNHNRNEYAFKTRSGDIKFKLRLMRNQRTFNGE